MELFTKYFDLDETAFLFKKKIGSGLHFPTSEEAVYFHLQNTNPINAPWFHMYRNSAPR